jgi:hypothetical protein
MAALATIPLVQLVPPEEPLAGNYFVAAYPPFSCWLPSQIRAVEEALLEPASDEPLGSTTRSIKRSATPKLRTGGL